MTSSAPPRSDRIACLVNYGLFIAAPFTFGALAIAAVVIAYVRRKGADPLSRSHYDHQIRSFWMDLIAVVLGMFCAGAALAGGIGTLFSATGANRAGLAGLEIWTLVFAVAWIALWVLGLGGLMATSVAGAIQLASGEPARKRRGP